LTTFDGEQLKKSSVNIESFLRNYNNNYNNNYYYYEYYYYYYYY